MGVEAVVSEEEGAHMAKRGAARRVDMLDRGQMPVRIPGALAMVQRLHYNMFERGRFCLEYRLNSV